MNNVTGNLSPLVFKFEEIMKEPSRLTMQQFERLSKLIYDISGICLKENKLTLLSNRLRKRLEVLSFEDFNEYFAYLFSGGGYSSEIDQIINAISTNETYFYRTDAQFRVMIDVVMPKLMEKGTSISILSAGCSTGEEPYTIAMMLNEKGWLKNGIVSIKGVDINSEVIDLAGRGIYDEKSIRLLPDEYKEKYFIPTDNKKYKLCDDIKSRVSFERLNLKNGTIDGKYTIVFCRNVMIYFDRDDQVALINRIYNSMESGGYFFIGHSESLYFLSNVFKYDMIYGTPVYFKE